jgi:D-alanyl-D-alanine dipeptidase
MKRLILAASLLICAYFSQFLFSANHKNPKPKLVNILSVIPDALTDIRYATKNNFTGEILSGYKKPYCLVRPQTASALKRVQIVLKKQGYLLKFFDCYRPLRASRHMIKWAKVNKPSWLGLYIGRRISLKSKYGHSNANAVDLTLVCIKTNKNINMGTGFDDFRKKAWTKNAKGKIFKNRMILYNAMKRNGFKNFYSEWWHYSYQNEPAPPLDLVIE